MVTKAIYNCHEWHILIKRLSLTLTTHSLGSSFHLHNVIRMISEGWKLEQDLEIIKYVEYYFFQKIIHNVQSLLKWIPPEYG